MTTPSQAAFEQHFKDFYDLPDTEFPKFNGSYTQSHQHREYAHWQAAEANGRKQALEEAITIFSEARNTIFYGATVEQKIKELLK